MTMTSSGIVIDPFGLPVFGGFFSCHFALSCLFGTRNAEQQWTPGTPGSDVEHVKLLKKKCKYNFRCQSESVKACIVNW